MEIMKNIKGLSEADKELALEELPFEVEVDGRTVTVYAVNLYAAKRKAREIAENDS